MPLLQDCTIGHGPAPSYPDHFPRHSSSQFPAPHTSSDFSSTTAASYSSAPAMVADYHSGSAPGVHPGSAHPGGPQSFMPSPGLYGTPLHMRPQPYPTRQDQMFCSHFPSPQSLETSPNFAPTYGGPTSHPGAHEDRWRGHWGLAEGPGPGTGPMNFPPPRQQLSFAPFVLGGVPGSGEPTEGQSEGSDQDLPVVQTRRQNSKESQHPDLQVFDSVPGRLCLLSSSSKYKVSVGEIKRRISGPECLNASLLGGVLRRAKSKNGGTNLRTRLEKIGLSLPAGRRKGTTVTVLTSLVEEEALKLASDYKTVCEQSFPSKSLGEGLVKALASEKKDAQLVSNIVRSTNVALRVLVDLLRRDRSPGGPRRPSVGALLDPGLQRQLTNFNLLTHNFGNPAVLATLETMRAVVLSAEENLGASAMPGGADLKKEKAEKKAQEKE